MPRVAPGPQLAKTRGHRRGSPASRRCSAQHRPGRLGHPRGRGRSAEPWDGGELRADRHENNLWCRRHPAGAWSLDIVINEGDAERWIYRRDPQLRLTWNEAMLAAPSGVPHLAPELQLLFKSSHVRAKDDIDAREVIPELSTERRERLGRLLTADHRWQALLRHLAELRVIAWLRFVTPTRRSGTGGVALRRLIVDGRPMTTADSVRWLSEYHLKVGEVPTVSRSADRKLRADVAVGGRSTPAPSRGHGLV